MFDLFTAQWAERRKRASRRRIEDTHACIRADIGMTRQQLLRRLRHRRPSPL